MNHAPPSARRAAPFRPASRNFDATRRGCYPAVSQRPPSIRQTALPRFALAEERLDASEVVATSPRKAMTPAFAARAIRARADSTQEIGVEDILLEVYADPPPSAAKRQPASARVAAASPRPSARVAAPSPSPSEQRAVDDLLREAVPPEPAPRQPLTPTPGVWPMQARVWSTPPLPMSPPDYHAAPPPSIAPVTASVEVMSPEAARHLGATTPPSSAARIALLGVVLLLAGVVIGVAIAVAFPEGPLGRLIRTSGRGRVAAAAQPARAPISPPRAAAPITPTARVVAASVTAAPVTPAPPVVAPTAVAAAASAAKVPSGSPVAAALASATTPHAPPTGGVLVLPPKAAGHRVWIDRAVIDGNARSVLVPCGPHKIKIGSKGHARRVNVPCGGTLTL